MFDAFYAELRRCRLHCDRRDRSLVDHRTPLEHKCDKRCGSHKCRPLSKSTIRQIHVILSGTLKRAVRWGWIARNPIENAENTAAAGAEPAPTERGRGGADPGGGVEGSGLGGSGLADDGDRIPAGELCGLRWADVDLEAGTLSIGRSIAQLDSRTWEKDTKTHHQRRIALDEESRGVLRDYRQRCQEGAGAAGVELPGSAVRVRRATGRSDTSGAAVGRPALRQDGSGAGVRTTIRKLRHNSATELISAGVDVRTVAGRLGHGGGGATTLRVYAAWVSESDQRAVQSLVSRLPRRPTSSPDGR